jgi:hypothetical protein
MENDAGLDEQDERLGLRCLTAVEIARELGQPVRSVMETAGQAALLQSRPVEDVLRQWFAELLSP